MVNFKGRIQKILSQAGIEINGQNPYDIQVHNDKLYQRVLAQGNLGLGESYMDGWWDCEQIDELIAKIIRADLSKHIKPNIGFLFDYIVAKFFNLQTKSRSFEVGKKHYDAGNDLYKNMLDKRMVYTCGYWKNAKTLDQAQEDKLDLTCRKLNLKPGMKILDIGCGWGSFAKYAAEKYKVKVIGITVSKEQVELGRKLCKGLDVEIRLQDYREVNEKFDAIVSLGMFEHVGNKNYREYMKVVRRCLKDNGLFLLHTIGRNDFSTHTSDPWLMKYIFPNSMIPSAVQITKASEGLFTIEDWHNFGIDYDKTLMAWHKNFNKNWNKIKDNYNARFKRMWNYYLLICAGAFRSRKKQLWQVVLSKNRVNRGYQSIR